jgi:hypothetical protein
MAEHIPIFGEISGWVCEGITKYYATDKGIFLVIFEIPLFRLLQDRLSVEIHGFLGWMG